MSYLYSKLFFLSYTQLYTFIHIFKYLCSFTHNIIINVKGKGRHERNKNKKWFEIIQDFHRLFKMNYFIFNYKIKFKEFHVIIIS